MPLTNGIILAVRRAVKGEQRHRLLALRALCRYTATVNAAPRFRTISAVARERFSV